MRLSTTDQFITAVSKKLTIHYRIKKTYGSKDKYKWSSYVHGPFGIVFDPMMYDYYVDCPIAMWTKDVTSAMYQQFMRTKDLTSLIQQSQPFDPFGACSDYWEYVGFIRRLEDDRYYHVKMGYDCKWLGIWEVEDVN